MSLAYDGSAPGAPRLGSCAGKTGMGANFTAEFKAHLRKFWEVQADVYEKNAAGWIMWSWKLERGGEWSYKNGVEYGWM